jgi:hypothetical protein
MAGNKCTEIKLQQGLLIKPIFFLICFLVGTAVFGQTSSPEKKIVANTNTWFSINSTLRFSEHWGMVGDFHVRWEDFLTEDYFYFLRTGAVYWISGKYPVILGVAHLWLAPPEGKNTWSDENRIYQQWSGTQKMGIVSVLNRVRFEQRWKDLIINDQVSGDKVFSLRLRYLASFEVKPFKNPKIPALVASDEVCVQFGESVVYNTFDQNRLFIGLKEPLSKELSFDVGYMNILQQKSIGNQYSLSHVFRLFFYYTVDFRKGKII